MSGASGDDRPRKGREVMRKTILLLPMIAVAMLLFSGVALLAPGLAHAQSTMGTTFTVNSTADASDSDTTDNLCDTDASTEGQQCTLRAAIEQANVGALWGDSTHDTIEFDIPGTGVHTIAVNKGLPSIEDPVTIDGYSQPGAKENTLAKGNDAAPKIELSGGKVYVMGAEGSVVKGLVINRSFTMSGGDPQPYAGVGILLQNASNTVVEGNYIGTDASGTKDLGNMVGVYVTEDSDNVTIGGTTPAARNIISGNDVNGIVLEGGTANKVQGNYIGTDKNGTADLGNGQGGVYIYNSSDNLIGGTTAGEGNTIAFNGEFGVQVIRFKSQFMAPPFIAEGNSILGNSIFSNKRFDPTSEYGGLGINLYGGRELATGVNVNDEGDPDAGSNNRQNFPVIASAKTFGGGTVIRGTLNSTPNTSFTVQFFSNPKKDASGYGEGKRFVGEATVSTAGDGNVSFTFEPTQKVRAGKFITATATNQTTGDTSEFSKARQVL